MKKSRTILHTAQILTGITAAAAAYALMPRREPAYRGLPSRHGDKLFAALHPTHAALPHLLRRDPIHGDLQRRSRWPRRNHHHPQAWLAARVAGLAPATPQYLASLANELILPGPSPTDQLPLGFTLKISAHSADQIGIK